MADENTGRLVEMKTLRAKSQGFDGSVNWTRTACSGVPQKNPTTICERPRLLTDKRKGLLNNGKAFLTRPEIFMMRLSHLNVSAR